MQRSQVLSRSVAGTWLLLLSTLLVCVPRAAGLAGSGHAAEVSGVVRDAAGIAQMGALVQVLGSDATPAGSAFTDARGHYLIGGLRAGNYRVRASATLLVPVIQTNLRLQAGATLVVNLTLAALFDAAQWLPAKRRGAGEPDDDWKWTLRSTANRPILQWVDADDQELGRRAAASGKEGSASSAKLHGALEVGGQTGRFGQGDAQSALSLRRESADGTRIGIHLESGSGSPAVREVAVTYGGGGTAAEDATEFSLRALNHPELATSGAPGGLQVVQLASGRRVAIGTRVTVEAGSELDAVRLGETAIVLRPFLRLEAHPNDAWAIGLRLASDPDFQDLADVSGRRGELPAIGKIAGRLRTATGTHTELALAHKNGRSTVELACFHDDLEHTTLRGGGPGLRLDGASQVGAGALPDDEALVDPFTGSFRGLGPAVHSVGGRVRVRTPLSPTVWLEAEYTLGDALTAPDATAASYAEAVHALRPELSSALSAALEGRLPAAGTRLRVSYRSQPGRTVTAVDSYGSGRQDAFLGVTARQPIRWAGHLPEGLDATLDLVNLLAQGYRPFLSADGRTLYLAQMPRAIQAGIAFTF